MVTSWDQSQIESLLDIHGEMLFVLGIDREEQVPGGVTLFNSTSRFEKEFFAFRAHLSQNGTVSGPLPGVFLMECMAQTAAFGLTVSFPNWTFLVSHFNVALIKPVVPGTITSSCKVPAVWSDSEKMIKVTVTYWQDGSIVGRGDLSYSKIPDLALENP
jgi:3-hydroxymyristoyl/3-hydroxydecanoyl-(acyl carrier protein) dehydratase